MLTSHLGAVPCCARLCQERKEYTPSEKGVGSGGERERLILTWNLTIHSSATLRYSPQDPNGWIGYLFVYLFRFWLWFPWIRSKHLKNEAPNISTTTSLCSGSKKKANFCWCSKDVLKQNISVLPAVEERAGDTTVLPGQHYHVCWSFLLTPFLVAGREPILLWSLWGHICT